MELAHLEDVHIIFYLAVKKQIIEKMQNISSLMTEHSEFRKYFLDRQDQNI